MELSGPAGRLYGPVGQSRTVLPLGGFGRWVATVQAHVFNATRLGPMRGRTAEPATITGRAEGWTGHPFYWPAWCGSNLEVEIDEAGTCWRFSAAVTWDGAQLRFKSIGQARCLPKKGG